MRLRLGRGDAGEKERGEGLGEDEPERMTTTETDDREHTGGADVVNRRDGYRNDHSMQSGRLCSVLISSMRLTSSGVLKKESKERWSGGGSFGRPVWARAGEWAGSGTSGKSKWEAEQTEESRRVELAVGDSSHLIGVRISITHGKDDRPRACGGGERPNALKLISDVCT